MLIDFKDIEGNRELLPKQVYDFIMTFDTDKQIRVAEIDPQYADGESLHEKYDVPYEMELNCLILEGKRNGLSRYGAVVVPYGKRASMNAKVRKPLDAKDVSFADLNYVKEVTGMEYGAITPIGLPEDWLIMIDESVFQQEYVIVGGGLARSKLLLPSKLFKSISGCIVIEGLAKD